MSMQTLHLRSSVLQLAVKEKGALHAAYIPFFEGGGIFFATQRSFRLGEDVYLLLTLPEDAQRYPIAGKIGWITPSGAGGHRMQGIGVSFPEDEMGAQLKAKIEQMLGADLASEQPTQTL